MTDVRPGVFIADEQGLGKTMTALAIIEATQSYPTVVVAPAVAKINWALEVGMTLDRTVTYVSGTKPYPVDADFVVVNWDILDSWVGAFEGYRGVIFDESHYAKNPVASRTKAAMALTTKMVAPDAVRLNLTGTAMPNRAAEFWPQIQLIRREADFGGTKAEFLRRYGARRGLLLLNRQLRKTCFVRRLKDDVMKDLPAKRWAPLVVEGDPGVMREYRRAEADVVTYLADRAEALAAKAGATTDEAKRAAMVAGFKAEQAEALVMIGTLRQLAAKAKKPAMRGWLDDFEGKVITFGWHRDIVDTISDEFAGGLKIQGGMTAEARQAAVERFQTDESAKVIACQIKAAGVAITLTAASNVLFVEQGWNPADMDQAIDRAHRIGQTDSVTGWIMMIPDTVDEYMAEIIAEKRKAVNAAVDGIDPDEEQASAVTSLMVRLAEKGLAAREARSA